MPSRCIVYFLPIHFATSVFILHFSQQEMVKTKRGRKRVKRGRKIRKGRERKVVRVAKGCNHSLSYYRQTLQMASRPTVRFFISLIDWFSYLLRQQQFRLAIRFSTLYPFKGNIRIFNVWSAVLILSMVVSQLTGILFF